MAAKGWKYGANHEPSQRLHDAMVPFEALSTRDRSSLIFVVEAEEVIRRLADIVDHQRGPERELRIEEMHPGLRVGWAERVVHDVPQWHDLTGEVIEWQTNDEGELESIDIQWSDGEIRSHYPQLRDLRRLAEAP